MSGGNPLLNFRTSLVRLLLTKQVYSNAKINSLGLRATLKSLSDEDVQNGKYSFKG